jgi:tRNA(Ile)-lysidine synthase
MPTLEEKIARTISAHRMFESGDHVAMAVSGGADSMALAVILHRLAPRYSMSVSVAHFNHQLRGEESDEDERFVRDFAKKLGLKCVVESSDVRAFAQSRGMNEEAAARQRRYEFLRSLIGSGAANKIALGHTANDQAETFLMRLLRGAGTRGLAAIHPVLENAFVRPLLEATREDVEQFLCNEGLAWREDASNADRTRTRNRIRHELLPLLREQFNPEIVAQLARTAAQCRLDDQFLTQLAAARFNQIRQPLNSSGRNTGAEDSREGMALPIEGLMQLEPALFGRVVRLAIQTVCGHLFRIDENHVDSVGRLLKQGHSGDVLSLPHHLCVERVFDLLHFSQTPTRPRAGESYELTVPASGVLRLPYPRMTWRIRLLDQTLWQEEGAQESSLKTDKKRDGEQTHGGCFDYVKIASHLEASGSDHLIVRDARPGDRYQPRGRGHSVKVMDLLAALHVPASHRKGWPVLVAGEKVIWMWCGKEAREVAVSPASHQILVIDEVDERGE